ncbi:MAG: ral secretion pathway protein GspG [Pseudomonadota bacterium]|jgi:hypothetical protein
MRRIARKNCCAERGVTRVELLAALGIAGLLFGSATLWLGRAAEDDQRGQAVKTAKELLGAASDFKRTKPDVGCPTISLLIHEERYDRSAPADDPWGGRYRIRCSAEDVEVLSAGKDGRFSTPDDIAVNGGWNS